MPAIQSLSFGSALTILLALAPFINATPLAAPKPNAEIFALKVRGALPQDYYNDNNDYNDPDSNDNSNQGTSSYSTTSSGGVTTDSSSASFVNLVAGSPDPSAGSVGAITVTANVGQVWNIQWTTGNGNPIGLAVGNSTWDTLIYGPMPVSPNFYNWTITVPAGITSGRYALGLAQQGGGVEYSPAFTILVPTVVNGQTVTPAAPMMTSWYDPDCSCHRTSTMSYPSMPQTSTTAPVPGSSMTTSVPASTMASGTTATMTPPATMINWTTSATWAMTSPTVYVSTVTYWDEDCSCHKTSMVPQAMPSVTVTVGSCQVSNGKNGTMPGGSCPGGASTNNNANNGNGPAGGANNYTMPTIAPAPSMGNGNSGSKYTGAAADDGVVPLLHLVGFLGLGVVLLI